MNWQKWSAMLLAATEVALGCSQPLSSPSSTAPKSASEAEILWATSHETGDLSDWYRDQGGGAFITGTADVSVTDEAAHTGKYSAKLEVWGIDKEVRGARLFRWGEYLTEGYFSAWYLFPVLPQVNDWLNIFEFKKKDYAKGEGNGAIDPTWYNVVKNYPCRWGIFLTLTHWNQVYNLPGNVRDSPLIRVGEWFHIEWYYKDGLEDGVVRIWINGELIWDMENVDTRGVDPHIQWAPVLYGTGVTPGHLALYVDDAAVSTQRVGPQASLSAE